MVWGSGCQLACELSLLPEPLESMAERLRDVSAPEATEIRGLFYQNVSESSIKESIVCCDV